MHFKSASALPTARQHSHLVERLDPSNASSIQNDKLLLHRCFQELINQLEAKALLLATSCSTFLQRPSRFSRQILVASASFLVPLYERRWCRVQSTNDGALQLHGGQSSPAMRWTSAGAAAPPRRCARLQLRLWASARCSGLAAKLAQPALGQTIPPDVVPLGQRLAPKDVPHQCRICTSVRAWWRCLSHARLELHSVSIHCRSDPSNRPGPLPAPERGDPSTSQTSFSAWRIGMRRYSDNCLASKFAAACPPWTLSPPARVSNCQGDHDWCPSLGSQSWLHLRTRHQSCSNRSKCFPVRSRENPRQTQLGYSRYAACWLYSPSLRCKKWYVMQMMQTAILTWLSLTTFIPNPFDQDRQNKRSSVLTMPGTDLFSLATLVIW